MMLVDEIKRILEVSGVSNPKFVGKRLVDRCDFEKIITERGSIHTLEHKYLDTEYIFVDESGNRYFFHSSLLG